MWFHLERAIDDKVGRNTSALRDTAALSLTPNSPNMPMRSRSLSATRRLSTSSTHWKTRTPRVRAIIAVMRRVSSVAPTKGSLPEVRRSIRTTRRCVNISAKHMSSRANSISLKISSQPSRSSVDRKSASTTKISLKRWRGRTSYKRSADRRGTRRLHLAAPRATREVPPHAMAWWCLRRRLSPGLFDPPSALDLLVFAQASVREGVLRGTVSWT